MNITPQQDKIILKYIDTAIERERALWKNDMAEYHDDMLKDFKDHTTALREGFRDDIFIMKEMMLEFPTRAEVREIVKEEIKEELKPIRSDLSIIKLEISTINKRLTKVEDVVL